MEIHAALARNVRKRRTELGLSQEALADAAGLDRTYISGIERGLRNPTIEVVSKLASALQQQPAALLVIK
ncbi:helix-turn-helix domain-containing protein [Kordiimonas gwangyangensis]|uniref:helix-turn-helix domain-containing protein n=1 Tax=Kordiimonas gwangyangensis TaxID=288022 RepID=UPI0003692701|nr:helix-turn-helix transcriptional regulator [Kordiimonas gwangyangensis]